MADTITTSVSRIAAPTIHPAEADAVRLHMAAVNALSEALHTLRTADLSHEALSRAIGRARRGATHLRHMAELTGSAA